MPTDDYTISQSDIDLEGSGASQTNELGQNPTRKKILGIPKVLIASLLLIVLIVIAVTLLRDEFGSSAVPADWETYSSIEGAPQYSLRYPSGSELQSPKGNAVINIGEEKLIVSRRASTSGFTGLTDRDKIATENNIILSSREYQIGKYPARQIEYIINTPAVGQGEQQYVLNTEIFTGSSLFWCDLTVPHSQNRDEAYLDNAKQVYNKIIDSIRTGS
ncbi:MAG: hypothetical protein AAB360_00325 [Patescibacteria group bacterium]